MAASMCLAPTVGLPAATATRSRASAVSGAEGSSFSAWPRASMARSRSSSFSSATSATRRHHSAFSGPLSSRRDAHLVQRRPARRSRRGPRPAAPGCRPRPGAGRDRPAAPRSAASALVCSGCRSRASRKATIAPSLLSSFDRRSSPRAGQEPGLLRRCRRPRRPRAPGPLPAPCSGPACPAASPAGPAPRASCPGTLTIRCRNSTALPGSPSCSSYSCASRQASVCSSSGSRWLSSRAAVHRRQLGVFAGGRRQPLQRLARPGLGRLLGERQRPGVERPPGIVLLLLADAGDLRQDLQPHPRGLLDLQAQLQQLDQLGPLAGAAQHRLQRRHRLQAVGFVAGDLPQRLPGARRGRGCG